MRSCYSHCHRIYLPFDDDINTEWYKILRYLFTPALHTPPTLRHVILRFFMPPRQPRHTTYCFHYAIDCRLRHLLLRQLLVTLRRDTGDAAPHRAIIWCYIAFAVTPCQLSDKIHSAFSLRLSFCCWVFARYDYFVTDTLYADTCDATPSSPPSPRYAYFSLLRRLCRRLQLLHFDIADYWGFSPPLCRDTRLRCFGFTPLRRIYYAIAAAEAATSPPLFSAAAFFFFISPSFFFCHAAARRWMILSSWRYSRRRSRGSLMNAHVWLPRHHEELYWLNIFIRHI